MHIFNKSGGKHTTCPLFMLSLSLPRKWHFFCTIRNYPPRILTSPTHHTKTWSAARGFLCSVFGFVPGAMRVFYAGLFAYLLHFVLVYPGKPQSVTFAKITFAHPPPGSIFPIVKRMVSPLLKRGASLLAVLYST